MVGNLKCGCPSHHEHDERGPAGCLVCTDARITVLEAAVGYLRQAGMEYLMQANDRWEQTLTPFVALAKAVNSDCLDEWAAALHREEERGRLFYSEDKSFSPIALARYLEKVKAALAHPVVQRVLGGGDE